MTDERLGQMLAALPTRRLPAEAEAALLARLQAAERPRGLRRPVALWQALAAAMVGLAIGLAGPSLVAGEPAPGKVVVSLESDWFATRSEPAVGLDITRWSPRGGRGGM